jgi:hypothetical protein
MTDISSLKALIARAEATGAIDGNEAKILLVQKFGREVIALFDKYAAPTNPDGLSTLDIERTLVGLVGCIVKSTTQSRIQAVLVARELSKDLIRAATED